ncbi:unnamed protein product [Paramecium sonneborni]|uniref:Uncharacterized protein n=1 Tax=Paramecium sonneborni TaxID=65129 RepID=A0A8S1P346_9CILI|nr:unnamed protein product [Paramecium sonneborni]
MSRQQSPKRVKQISQEERQKKLFMKTALNSLRKYFNNKALPYHPLITCVSIKPGCINRCASLQSYPNQNVWKYLVELPKAIQLEVAEFLIKELYGKQQKFSPKFLIEATQRINNNFDFQSFYKDPTQTDNITNENELEFYQNNINEVKNNGTVIKQKKWSKGEGFVSESKQISTQMRLCNQYPPLIKVDQVHYHKMRCLLEKIKVQKYKQSEEMKIFVEELQKFIQKDPKAHDLKPKKKIKKSNDQKDYQQDDEESIQRSKTLLNEVKVEENSAQDFLEQFKMKIKSIEPGIVMYLPEYQKIDPQYRQFYKNLEDNYYKDLYYKVRTEDLILNPQNILKLLKQAFQNVNYIIPFKEEHDISQK